MVVMSVMKKRWWRWLIITDDTRSVVTMTIMLVNKLSVVALCGPHAFSFPVEMESVVHYFLYHWGIIYIIIIIINILIVIIIDISSFSQLLSSSVSIEADVDEMVNCKTFLMKIKRLNKADCCHRASQFISVGDVHNSARCRDSRQKKSEDRQWRRKMPSARPVHLIINSLQIYSDEIDKLPGTYPGGSSSMVHVEPRQRLRCACSSLAVDFGLTQTTKPFLWGRVLPAREWPTKGS